MPGWKAYFRLAQTPTVMRELDEWLRHRLRAIQLKQWKRGDDDVPRADGAWARPTLWLDGSRATHDAGGATARMGLNRLLPIAYFDRLGVPRFS